ncbi:MAG: glycoside hydrolase, partial [Gammaproteobacteria bacterium]|nr:glycoside hydrolase [Gammaproteobacteria bacterium]
MNVTNLIIKPALFTVYVALMFSFIGCAVMNSTEPESTRDESWTAVSTLPSGIRSSFQSMVLTNGDLLVMGGVASSIEYLNDIWLSSDKGSNWNEITNQTPWTVRANFQALVLPNNNILVMGGTSCCVYYDLDDIWLSKDSGRNWSQIPASGHWSPMYGFQAVVLNNGDLLVMGGTRLIGGARYISDDVYLSKNGGTNWTLIASSNHWSARYKFQAVVLANNDILVLGG